MPAAACRDESARRRALIWYPAIGVIVGAVVGTAALGLRRTAGLLAAAVVLAVWVLLTGALHLDGLADTADAWVGGMGDRTRTLAIMKDPASGPVAVVAVLLVLLLKFSALATILGGGQLGLALVLGVGAVPLIARTWLVLAFVSTPYARPNGMGSELKGVGRTPAWVAVVVGAGGAIAGMWAGFGVGSVAAALVAVGVFVGWRVGVVRRIGGFTGDTAGALVELTETAVVLSLALTYGPG